MTETKHEEKSPTSIWEKIKDLASGEVKKQLTTLFKAYKQISKAIDKLTKEKQQVQTRWKNQFQKERKDRLAFMKELQKLRDNVRGGKSFNFDFLLSDKFDGFMENLKKWDEESPRLTEERDKKIAEIAEKKQALEKIESTAGNLYQDFQGRTNMYDSIIDRWFIANEAVRHAIEVRDEMFLKEIERELKDNLGNKIKKDYVHSDGKRKVIATFNQSDVINQACAHKAKTLITEYFHKKSGLSKKEGEEIQKLLTSILGELTKYTPGTNIMKFLNENFETEDELMIQAQELLRNGFEKKESGHYTIGQEKDQFGRWVQVKKS